MKRLREEAKDEQRLIDATQGRRTRSIVITDSNHVVLSAVQAETIAQRFNSDVLSKEGGKERMKKSKGDLFVVSAPSGARQDNIVPEARFR